MQPLRTPADKGPELSALTPRPRPPAVPSALAADRDELLEASLAGVRGWLHRGEAIELYELARAADSGSIVEIGSYHGRSTICLALGARAGGTRRVIAIDPQTLEVGQQAKLDKNLCNAGVRDLVDIVASTSHMARALIPDCSVGLLFVDGSHEYDDVRQDIEDWTSALIPGAVAAFNDPYWSDVGRALRDEIAQRGSPYRNPRWTDKTLFVDYRPDLPWRIRDGWNRIRLRAYLFIGGAWWRWHERHVGCHPRSAALSVRAIIRVEAVLLRSARRVRDFPRAG